MSGTAPVARGGRVALDEAALRARATA
ncbi:MAG: hypothetical protein JWO74_3952, partial [Solirubrobacterales bacterium]|nr:hypothetical protein [Solirubrobacterales bacterium]